MDLTADGETPTNNPRGGSEVAMDVNSSIRARKLTAARGRSRQPSGSELVGRQGSVDDVCGQGRRPACRFSSRDFCQGCRPGLSYSAPHGAEQGPPE